MGKLADYEYVIFVVTLVVLWLAVEFGAWLARLRPAKETEQSHLAQVASASISILALIIAFSFSAALGRYDQRKHYEQNEASNIGELYEMTSLLPDDDAAELRGLIAQYVALRVDFFETSNREELARLHDKLVALEHRMWPIVQRNARDHQTPVMAQVLQALAAMVGSADASQAASEDRIPDTGWTLMAVLAFLSCVTIGYGEYGGHSHLLRLVLPMLVAIVFFFIASLDAQRTGLIRVGPVNLMRVQHDIVAEQKK